MTAQTLTSGSRFAGKRIHFIGIGGSGMSGLARMLLDCGAVVSGSEPQPNSVTFSLTAAGAKISRDQIGELLSKQIDLVVRTAAVADDNREFLAARTLGLAHLKYAELLGQVMAERFGVAVAGTHGKSTTSAMISHALLQCGADPSFVIGGTVPQLGGGSRSGQGQAFVAEACEYDRSFHNLRPRVALITNIEEDHLDCYKDIEQIIESFRTFARLVPADGLIIANAQDRNVAAALRDVDAAVQTVSLDGRATWQARETSLRGGCCTGEIWRDGENAAEIALSVPGRHNLFNAAMAVAACAACGIEPSQAAHAIGGFSGVDRRLSEVGRFNGSLVVDDYAHHPTEIRATLSAARQRWQPRRLFCVFQPHQHSRTRFLLEDFAKSFALADEILVPDIYFVRDSQTERQRVSADDLVARIVGNGRQARHLPDFASIVEHLRRQARDGDLIITMGAGNVWEIGRELVEK